MPRTGRMQSQLHFVMGQLLLDHEGLPARCERTVAEGERIRALAGPPGGALSFGKSGLKACLSFSAYHRERRGPNAVRGFASTTGSFGALRICRSSFFQPPRCRCQELASSLFEIGRYCAARRGSAKSL